MSEDMSENEKSRLKTLDLRIENFGPINKGNINLKPLTILIGPNNSGKSYLVMLIKSIFKSSLDRNTLSSALTHRYMDAVSDGKGNSTMQFLEFKNQVTNLKKNDSIYLSNKAIGEFIDNIFNYIYTIKLRNDLMYSFSSPLKELVKIGENHFKIEINLNNLNISLSNKGDNLEIINSPKIDIAIKVSADDESPIIVRYSEITNKEGKKEYIILYNEKLMKEMQGFKGKELKFLYLIHAITYILCIELENNFNTFPCYYLPAARSNLVQGYKALLSDTAKNLPLLGMKGILPEGIEVPKFSGVVADFISTINDFKVNIGPFGTLAKRLEKELMGGEIVIEEPEKNANRQIYYKYEETNIPLHRVSSTISELTPITLYIKYILKPGDTLIIEEPEAHLHPENQRILAKFLVRLIRGGVFLIITTHSDYLLQQLNTFIRLSNISPEKRAKRYGYNRNDFIGFDEVAAFSFARNKGGYQINNVAITKEEGISQDEFYRIYKILYKESVKLQRDLNELANTE
jgi:predicted ATPase